MEQVLPYDDRLLSQQYRQWEASQGLSIFDQLSAQAKVDMEESQRLLKEAASQKVSAPAEVDPEPYHNCLNCHVKFAPQPELVTLYNVHCSPNCALRSNQNAFEQGAISGYIYQAIIDKIERFFELDGIEPFPPFQSYRGTIWQYHSEKPMPPGFVITYFNRREADEFDAIGDQMEVENTLLSEF